MPKNLVSVFFGIILALSLVLSFGRIKRNRLLFEINKMQQTGSVLSENTIAKESVFRKYLKPLSQNNSKQKLPNKLAKKEVFDTLIAEVQNTPGTFSIYIKDLKFDEVYALNTEEEYYGASLYKTPVAIATFAALEDELIRPDQSVAYTPADFEGGSGVIQNSNYYSTYTVSKLTDYLLTTSDNIAQIMLMRTVPSSFFQAAFTAAADTPENGLKFYNENIVSVGTAAANYDYLYKVSTYLTYSEFLSPESANEIIKLMDDTSFDDRIELGLPSNTEFFHKIGNWGYEGSWHDCGLAKTKASVYTICVLSKNTDFDSFVKMAKSAGEIID